MKMELICRLEGLGPRLKESYMDGARYNYLTARIEMASSRYLKATDTGNRMTENMHWGYKSRLEDRAKEITFKYTNESLIVRMAFEAGRVQTKRRTYFRGLEAKAFRLARSRLYPINRNLRSIK